MPSYSPLPNVELDPRNEAELVQAAARRVYEASNATLNDFSSGSPIVALLEGQAFAQAEFLQFANQFPESVLVEWIGPFLGAQRRTGSGAIVGVTFTIDPRDDQFDVFPGYQLGTDSNLTGGEQIVFITTERLTIPAGQSQGTVSCISALRSRSANVGPFTVNRTLTSLAGVRSVTNADAAAGGQDPELLSEVKERFFSLIRRRNPVSAEDWQDFFSDALGPGAATTVLPRRSERETYRYAEDYVVSAPAVSFFVLNPDGTPITTAQQGALTNLIRWSLPVEFIGYVYPMEVNDVDFNIELLYDSGKPYAQNLTNFSRIVRNNLFALMQPNAVFPTSYDQSVTDVESALGTTFPLTLGTTNQYLDPDIASIKAYVPPVDVSISNFGLVQPQPFKSGNTIQSGDLVIEQGNTFATYYEALEGFTPELSDKTYFVNTGDLQVEVIRTLSAGEYTTGDVVSVGDLGDLHVVLAPFTFRLVLTAAQLIERGLLSAAKTYTGWDKDTTYSPLDENGGYNPQIIKYEQTDTQFNVFIPSLPADLSLDRRPGFPVYVVSKEFTVTANTTTLGTAQSEGLVSSTSTTVQVLKDNTQYLADSFVKTPDPTELLSGDINRENCYIDQVAGASELFAKVIRTFTFQSNNDYNSSVDQLVNEGVIEIIQPVPFIDCKGDSSFSSKPFRYTARFRAGEYVRYRETGGYDSELLESCVDATNECDNVSEGCRKLFSREIDLPRYFFALRDFTPNTSDLNKLVEDEAVTEVSRSVFFATYSAYIPSTSTVTSSDITDALVAASVIPSSSSLVVGNTCNILGDVGEERGLYEWSGSEWAKVASGLPSFRDLFRFAPGDVAAFRSVSEVRSYVATEHVTPLLDIEVYYDNGVFISSTSTANVKWIDPNYHLEDIIFQTSNGATSFFRSTRSFTPPTLRTIWNDSSVLSTPRLEEIYTNCLKFVNLVECSEALTSRLRDGASTVKLGHVQLDTVSKTAGSITNTFVYESTQYASQSAALSVFPSSSFEYGPVDYGTGTLAL